MPFRRKPDSQLYEPSTPQQATLPLISHTHCDVPTAYNDTVNSPTMFCAGYWDGSADTCSGDSGGPVVDPNPDGRGNSSEATDRLVGIVSWGEGCAKPGFPGVYTRVDAQYDWIVSHGFCACLSTGGGMSSPPAGCHLASGAEVAPPGVTATAGSGQSGSGVCYVVTSELCSQARRSSRYTGAAWVACDLATNVSAPMQQQRSAQKCVTAVTDLGPQAER